MDESGNFPSDESLPEFVDRAVPAFDSAVDIEGWSETEREPRDSPVILVRLDPVAAGMTQDEFFDAVAESGETSSFEALLEYYPRNDTGSSTAPGSFEPRPGDGIIRLTGTRVEDAPRYYGDKISGVALLHGKYSRSNWVVGHLANDAFHGRDQQYLHEYRLFDDDGENRAEEIHHTQSVIDWIHSDEFDRVMEAMEQMTEEEREEFFDRLSEDVEE